MIIVKENATRVLNATIHNLTNNQILDGGVEPYPEFKEKIKGILLINDIPDRDELRNRAKQFASQVDKYRKIFFNDGTVMPSVLIGSGTPSIQPYIVKELKTLGIDYVYSHSERECVETHLPDGTVQKTFIFSHKGWY